VRPLRWSSPSIAADNAQPSPAGERRELLPEVAASVEALHGRVEQLSTAVNSVVIAQIQDRAAAFERGMEQVRRLADVTDRADIDAVRAELRQMDRRNGAVLADIAGQLSALRRNV